MRVILSIAAVFFISATATSASGRVDLSIRDGRVTLAAQDATLKEILDAWVRSGGTQVVNAEKIGGPTFTIQFNDVPEEQALDALLRSVSGYLAVPRSATAAAPSRFERIVILPSSTPFRAAVEPLPPPPPIPDTPVVAPTNVNGVARLIGPDGRPVEDDQSDAPAPPQRSSAPRQ